MLSTTQPCLLDLFWTCDIEHFLATIWSDKEQYKSQLYQKTWQKVMLYVDHGVFLCEIKVWLKLMPFWFISKNKNPFSLVCVVLPKGRTPPVWFHDLLKQCQHLIDQAEKSCFPLWLTPNGHWKFRIVMPEMIDYYISVIIF